jgi:hypothetical protein
MSSAMEQERELDRLLARVLTGREVSAPEPLQPMLTAARALMPLRQAAPSATFARSAEASMLRRARELRQGTSAADTAADTAADGAPPVASGAGITIVSRRRASNTRPFLWASAIAAILLVSAGGIFVAAADAQPGSVFYAVRRFEQGVQAQLTTNAAERVQLHLDNAQAALQAFDEAVAHQQRGAELSDALDTFLAEHAAAGVALADVTDSTSHARLAAALDQQRAQGISDLRAALADQDWSLRLRLTQALGALNVTIPVVRQVTLTESSDPTDSKGIGRLTTVVITGAGFQPGAQLLLRGIPTGTVLSVSGNSLVVQVRAAAQAIASQGSIGVDNPDGTTAVSAQAPVIVSGAHTTPSAVPTNNGDNGKHKGTPTPRP